ncbi:hypothetical protein EMCRGX_G000007 [Ephydatia muelleri]
MAVSEDKVASWKLEETVEWALKQYNSRVAHRFEAWCTVFFDLSEQEIDGETLLMLCKTGTTDLLKACGLETVKDQLINASILYNSVNEKKLTQMEFRIEVAKGLLKGYTKHQPKHFTVSQDLPLRLTERPFPERIPSDCPYGGRLLCEVCRVRGDKRSRTQ